MADEQAKEGSEKAMDRNTMRAVIREVSPERLPEGGRISPTRVREKEELSRAETVDLTRFR